MTKLKFTKTFLILLSIVIFQSCSSDSTNNNENENTNPDDYYYFISGKIDGEDFLFGLETNPTSIEFSDIAGASGTCTNDNSSYSGLNYSAGVYPTFSGGQSVIFEFVRFYLCSSSSSEVESFNSAFPTKSYTFSDTDDSYSGVNGSIAISYSPNIENDLYYTSFNGDSVNGTFTITKSTEKNEYLLEQLINVYQEIEGTFSVTLYSVDDPSDTVQITNGKFKLQVKLL